MWPPRQLTELQGQRTGQMRRDEGSAQQQLTLQARRARARTRRIQRQHACWGSQLRRAPQAKAAVGAVDSSQVDESGPRRAGATPLRERGRRQPVGLIA